MVFDNLPLLVATSQAVVVGTIESATKGHTIGDPEEGLFVRDVTVRVDAQLVGKSVGSSIIVDQVGYDGDESLEINELPWLFPGDRAVFFLVDTDSVPEGHWTFTALSGQLQILDGKVATNGEDPAIHRLGGRPWPEVRDEITAAAELVRTQGIEPLPGAPS
ncbi:hypothetical protein ABN034_18745 [Actinopolymorpha sp. B11F2]|uniref:hypothetical protein n=1 Tax=Actinopolymorpha sp. B11F2 TaxID=3160862 RepID=UPI0032E50132